jgi:hydroxypyruvate reductase 2
MKPEILVPGTLSPHVMERLKSFATVHDLAETADRAAFLRATGERIRAIATTNFHGAPTALIDACPKLELISSIGVGTDSLNVEHARARGIQVANTPDVLNDDVANMAVMLLLAGTRRFVAYDRYAREGRWACEGDPPLTRSIAGKPIGIVGMGRIGRVIADKLKAFHCRIAYAARRERTDLPYRYYRDVAELARDSMALVVIVPGGKETENLVDRRVMEALGPDGLLVNVARGSVVDEKALIAVLREGKLGGAALDVFVDEPNIPPALREMENVVLQPHQASATVETRRAMADLMVDNLVAHFEGRPLISPLP